MTDNGETLESRLRSKLEAGELSQDEFQELYTKFDRLGLLQSRTSSTTSKVRTNEGTTRLKGGKVNGPVNIHGRGVVDGDLECNQLSVSGTASIRGDLTVLGKSSISGLIEVEGVAKFVDRLAVSGSIEVEQSMYTLKSASLSGKTRVAADLINDEKCLVSGKFSAMNVKSTGKLHVNGKFTVDQDVLADDFQCDSGNVSIGGNLKARSISIFSQYIRPSASEDASEDPETIGDLVSNVVNNIFPTLVKTVTGIFDPSPKAFSVSQNIEGDEIWIANCSVNGDIIGDRVYIGPNVIVNGKVVYRTILQVDQRSSITSEQVE